MPRKTYAEFTTEQKKRFIETKNASIKRTTTRYLFQLHNTIDSDIIARLESVPNKAGYIKALIRADIAKETEENSNGKDF